jgi:hydroxymethylbilane synthase
VNAVETELLEGRADIGVHSAKDLPSAMTEGLVIAGVPTREAAEDAWLGPGSTIDGVPENSVVGTSSLRRRAQLLARRRDLEVVELHGNVDTRLRKLKGKKLDAIVLAVAGLRRLKREKDVSFLLEPRQMTPAAGQGALALQTREDDEEARESAAAISDESALAELTAERATIAAFGASCNTPVGVHARREDDSLAIDGFAGLPDGSIWVRDSLEGDAEDPEALGEELAQRMLAAGAGHILEMAEEQVAGR